MPFNCPAQLHMEDMCIASPREATVCMVYHGSQGFQTFTWRDDIIHTLCTEM